MFYQNFKVKYFTNFYKGFYNQWKIFYKFDEILHLNKHLKMGKYFTSEQMECQKYENCQTNPILEVNLNCTSNVLI